ncbi:MAG: isopenicillin N synthase family oxygenase [Pseudomonadales bacterium]|nr:isopenicillin N synthase family oxygenase [Pseudomonadales bacterium]
MKLTAVDYKAPGSDRLFVESLHETGFGVLKNHPIDQELVNSIYAHWAEFFASDEKHRYAYHRDTQDGFYSSDAAETAKNFRKKDIKEYFHFYPWGQCPESLRGELERYYAAAHDLAAELLAWVEQYSPAGITYSEPLSHMIDGSDQTLLRILNYPAFTGSEEAGAVRAAAHEDINLLTILPAADAGGLEVLTKEGTWIPVPCDFENLIINAGDMLQEASGGYFRSTSHRVVNPADADRSRARMSLPLFLHPRPDVVLSGKYTAGSYLSERLRELKVV